MAGEARALHLGRAGVLAFPWYHHERESVQVQHVSLKEWESISPRPFRANPLEC
jgi:hypothetical protein